MVNMRWNDVESWVPDGVNVSIAARNASNLPY